MHLMILYLIPDLGDEHEDQSDNSLEQNLAGSLHLISDRCGQVCIPLSTQQHRPLAPRSGQHSLPVRFMIRLRPSLSPPSR
jgi:hypothetical protein